MDLSERRLQKARQQSATGNAFDRLLADEAAAASAPAIPTRRRKRRSRRRKKRQWDGTYPSYLKSAHWQRTRAVILSRAGGRCEACRRELPLEVHHKRYRLFQEQPDDLIALCGECHGIEHEAKHGPRGDLWNEYAAIAAGR